MEQQRYQFLCKLKFNQNAFVTCFPAYQRMREVEQPVTYHRFTRWAKKGGLFDRKIFQGNAFGKVTLPEGLKGKLFIYDESGTQYPVEVIPVLPPKYRKEGVGGAEVKGYRRLLLRRDRIAKILTVDAPQIIIQNEMTMLMEAVLDVLRQTAETLSTLPKMWREEAYGKWKELGFSV